LTTSPRSLLRIEGVSKHFDGGAGAFRIHLFGGKARTVHAVSDVSLSLDQNEVLGLVGESGCGKSTLGRIVAGLLPLSGGMIDFAGMIRSPTSRPGRWDWAKNIQMIFQNPYASLNPRQRVKEIIQEPLRVHRLIPKAGVAGRAEELLRQVGLDSRYFDRYPHQLSGGQCQRVGIARALAVGPKVLICDEPVSALDVSIQAQVLNLFTELRDTTSIAYIFISHDLGVVERLSDRVAVMYLGRIVEIGTKAELFRDPKHPYTKILLASVPKIGRSRHDSIKIAGEQPSPLDPPRGCHFHPRCPRATDICRSVVPVMRELAPGQFAACHLF
jgi:peptide/nickel transport system ATP-binding protein